MLRPVIFNIFVNDDCGTECTPSMLADDTQLSGGGRDAVSRPPAPPHTALQKAAVRIPG